MQDAPLMVSNLAVKAKLNKALLFILLCLPVQAMLKCRWMMQGCSSNHGVKVWLCWTLECIKIRITLDQHKLLKPGIWVTDYIPGKKQHRRIPLQYYSDTLNHTWWPADRVCGRQTNDWETAAIDPLLNLICKPNPISTWYLHKQNWIRCLLLILQRRSSSMALWSCQSFNLMPLPASECNFAGSLAYISLDESKSMQHRIISDFLFPVSWIRSCKHIILITLYCTMYFNMERTFLRFNFMSTYRLQLCYDITDTQNKPS